MNPGPAVPPGYAFPERALRRWQAENLVLAPADGGGWNAVFRLEGCTCGNIPFHLRYRLAVASAEHRHLLLALACEPAPHDTNHRQQCGAKSDCAHFVAHLGADAPLLGRPLEEALSWSPATSPEGCVCAASARLHKWRIVLQTAHFALNQSPP
jgi:hypothetical protein